MMKGKTHGNKFLKFITMPLRALGKARDLYVRSMNNYADKVCYGTAGWGGPAYADPLTRSFSTRASRSSENDDFRELVRAASTSTLGNRVDLSSVLASARTREGINSTSNANLKKVPRSTSVGMAKIEEEKACEFDDDADVGNHGVNHNVKQKIRFFPRSRSYAVCATKRDTAVL